MASRSKKAKRIKLDTGRQLQIIQLQLLVLSFVVILTRCAGTKEIQDYATPQKKPWFAAGMLELPRFDNKEYLLYNASGRYTLYYDPVHIQAAWVAHVLTGADVAYKNSERGNNFTTDPAVKDKGWPYAVDEDYRNSGYDRGHLLPSADRDDSQAENNATFLFSNISPQHPALNRGAWNRLEDEVRNMAARLDTLYIATGPVFDGNGKRIGTGGVTVPSHFFKVLLGWNGEKYIAVGFVMANSGQAGSSWRNHAVTVDSVEVLSGLDFFHNLPDHYEAAAEGYFDLNEWK